ncbi:MAG: PilZ domain-containing protein [Candidatus Rokubacteria bacterium]|nr:PilZ domain-containing protein [Candidatus Rokubacteria bacterium]MBI2552995.1 PilZ domain-containing protein [Candidatus Rokubacteria bacterium]
MPSQGQRIIQIEERRRYPRVEVAWNVAVGWGPRFKWQGEIVSLSPFGVKVRLGEKEPGPPVGTEVRLQFAPPGRNAPMSIKGIVWRVDPDGLAIALLKLSVEEFHRLKSLVDTLLTEPGQPLEATERPSSASSRRGRGPLPRR